MIHTITFNLDANNENCADDKHELSQMLHAKKAFTAMSDFDAYLRGVYKWGEGDKPFDIESCREKWYEIINEYNINLDELE